MIETTVITGHDTITHTSKPNIINITIVIMKDESNLFIVVSLSCCK